MQGLCLYGVVVETIAVHYGLLPLDYCQWMEQLQLMWMSMGAVMVVTAVVLPAIPQN